MIDLGPLRRVPLASGIELAVIDTGPPAGANDSFETLIFLHGFPENHRSWRHQIAHLRDRYRCIAPEQRGYPRSAKPEGVESYTPDKLIGDVFQLADALDIDRFTIIGHDWGGAIAWGVAYAGQANGRVTRAIIANAPHPVLFPKLLLTNREQREASQYFRAFRDPANNTDIRERGLGPFLARTTSWQAHDDMEPDERALLLQDWADGDAGIAMLNWYRASRVDVPTPDAAYAIPPDWQPPQLPILEIPTLVIWAMDDKALPSANLDGIEKLIEKVTVVRVLDCGHFVQWERPDAVNTAIDDFLCG